MTRRLRFLGYVVAVVSASAWLAQVVAQTGFDGRYAGDAVLTSGRGTGCPQKYAVEMTVGGGQVSFKSPYCQTIPGTIDGSGKVSASAMCIGYLHTISGTILS